MSNDDSYYDRLMRTGSAASTINRKVIRAGHNGGPVYVLASRELAEIQRAMLDRMPVDQLTRLIGDHGYIIR